jgi:hypothetical protein
VLTIKLDTHESPGTVVSENSYHMRIGANATVGQLRTALASNEAATLRLEFPQESASARQDKFALEPFADQKAQDGFLRRIEHLPGFWCCRHPTGPQGKGGTPYSPMILGQGIEYRH